MTRYKRHTIIDGKVKLVIVENGKVINKNPSEEELKDLKTEHYKKCEKYTDSILLNYLKLFYDKYKRVPMKRDFDNNPEYPSSNVYHTRFESWNNALEMAGLCIRGKYTDKELLDILKRFYKENGRVPMQSDFVNNYGCPSYAFYRNRFGGWNKALLLAGLDTDTNRKIYTDDELLNYLKEFHNKNGRHPAQTDFTNNSKYPGFATYIYRFGSWKKALKLVGMDLDTRVRQGYCKTKIENGRSWEIMIGEMFDNKHIDLSGENCKSYLDGICPNGQTYEAKSGKLRTSGNWEGWSFSTGNEDKGDDIEAIQWWYFGAFNEDGTKLSYAWRVPGEIVEGSRFHVGTYSGKFNVGNMIEYEITDEFKKLYEQYTMNKKLDRA